MTYAREVHKKLRSFFEAHYKNVFHPNRSQVIDEFFTYNCYFKENDVTIVITTPIHMNDSGEVDLASSRKIQIRLIQTDTKTLLIRMKDVLMYHDWITRLNERIADLIRIAQSYSPKDGLDSISCSSKDIRWRKNGD